MRAIFLIILLCVCNSSFGKEITRIWLNHNSNTPDSITINWLSDEAGSSEVLFAYDQEKAQKFYEDEKVTLHSVTVPLNNKAQSYNYSVRTEGQKSKNFKFKSYNSDELRVAVVANWQANKDLSSLKQDNIHLLLTAGDNIPNLHSSCGDGIKDCVKPYIKLIDRYPEMFATTPFMPILGNHDKQIYPRGPKAPSFKVYDVDATSYRKFFTLPDNEWKWGFHLAGFDLQILALDLNHTSDFGNNWQTCHSFDENSEQYLWYKQQIESSKSKFKLTLMNEKIGVVKRLSKGIWQKEFEKGTTVVTGFGYFAERAEENGVKYINTSLGGTGAPYKDSESKFFKSSDNYVFLKFSKSKKSMKASLKDLSGNILDTFFIK